MSPIKTLFLAGFLAAGMAAPAGAAGYIKFDGVDGEAKAACAEEQTAEPRRAAGRPSEKTASEEAEACATAYGKDGRKGGNVEFEWKVEEGES